MELSQAPGLNELAPALDRFFDLAGQKIAALNRDWNPAEGSPVFTVEGKYTTRGWTEWTQGFMYGCQILQFDATGDERFLTMGRENTIRHMAPHVSHNGVHDHGFNNVSTYGNLRRLAIEGRTDDGPDAMNFYEMALKVSGAVQAARWTDLADGGGYIHSFNGPHSLFSDTIRSCRSLVVAHRLGHALMAENDARHDLLGRALTHIAATLKYNVYYGEGRDTWDVPGRVVHESIFNTKDGNYRCPSTQQGYSPFSTWTRGLAWILCGCAEQLEALDRFSEEDFAEAGHDLEATRVALLKAARATAEFQIHETPTDGIPYWDTGAPGLAAMPDWREKPSQVDNPHEPVDSSAAAISAQGLLRLGRLLGDTDEGRRFTQAGLLTARSLFSAPYLSEDPAHHGLVLHSIYHQPNGWDHTPEGKSIPQGESSMWGDYHAMELALWLRREIEGQTYYSFLVDA